jgi:hypothetical protein
MKISQGKIDRGSPRRKRKKTSKGCNFCNFHFGALLTRILDVSAYGDSFEPIKKFGKSGKWMFFWDR